MGAYSGISSLWSTSPQVGDPSLYLPFNVTGVGHVLDVILSTDHPSYDPLLNKVIGTIFYRNALAAAGAGGFNLSTFDEASETKYASPLDRSNFKVPLPGEQVLVYRAKSGKLDGPDDYLTSQWYYGSVVNMTANLTANVSPFIGIDPAFINPFLPGQKTVAQLASRFDKKISNLALFKGFNSKPIVHKQLQLNEGDFILQGRFGGSIRFAGTPIDKEASKQEWSKNKTGAPGDPIILMRLSNAKGNYNNIESTIYETENTDNDAASLYLTTTQQIPIKLAIPEKGDLVHSLATWAYTYGVTVGVDAVNTAGRAQDGEAARTGDNKIAPKEASNGDNYIEPSTQTIDVSTDVIAPDAADEGTTQPIQQTSSDKQN